MEQRKSITQAEANHLFGTNLVKMKWCKGSYTIDFCKEKVKELKATGKYVKAWHTRFKCSFDGKYYGRVWLLIDRATL